MDLLSSNLYCTATSLIGAKCNIQTMYVLRNFGALSGPRKIYSISHKIYQTKTQLELFVVQYSNVVHV